MLFIIFFKNEVRYSKTIKDENEKLTHELDQLKNSHDRGRLQLIFNDLNYLKEYIENLPKQDL